MNWRLLKHKGDRNYYEFTLNKGQKKPVGTVSLELKKADAKKSRFTLVVYSDDKQYEKKDRNLNEPLQFYSGKDPQLFEIVVNSVGGKNRRSPAICQRPRARRLRLLLNNSRVGRERYAGLILKFEGEVQILARVPLLFGSPDGPKGGSVQLLSRSDGDARRQRRVVCSADSSG